MPRLLALTGVLLIALVGAGSAQADHLAPIPPSSASPVVNNVGGGGTYRVTGAAQAAVAVRGYEPLAAPWSPGGTSSIPATINKMQRAGRVLPALRSVGAFAMTGAAFVVGQKIGDGLGGFIYTKLTGEAYDATPLGDGSYGAWAPMCLAATSGCNAIASPKVAPDSSPVSAFIGSEGFTAATEGYVFVNWYPPAYGGFIGPLTFCATTATCNAGWSSFTTPVDGLGTDMQRSVAPNPSPDCSSAGNCLLVWRTEKQMNEAVDHENIDETTFNAMTNKVTTTYAAPGDLGTNADMDAMGAVLVNSDGSQTEEQRAAEEAIAEDLYPGEVTDPYTFVVPQPEPNETYSAYVARLVAAGALGTITETENTNVNALYGPQAVTRLVLSTSPQRVLDPLSWPSSGVEISQATDITVRYNPASAEPVPTEGGTTTGPTTIPTAPAIDFSPITELDPGCKFPYGFICYAVDFTEQFDATADAPSFSFMLGIDQTLCEGCEADYTVDLNVMDDYMALWRGILTVVLWVGAIYLVATRMLGFKAGGDPGEAIDDVL